MNDDYSEAMQVYVLRHRRPYLMGLCLVWTIGGVVLAIVAIAWTPLLCWAALCWAMAAWQAWKLRRVNRRLEELER